MDNSAVGKKIAYLRKQHKLSQRELAERAAITSSAISAIENNKVSPSISSLQKIVNVFSMSLSEFFTSDLPDQEPQVVIKPDQLVEIGIGDVSMKLVRDGSRELKLGFLQEEYQPGAHTGEVKIAHDGEEAGIVIEGEIELVVGDRHYIIKQGESYLFDTSIPHRFTNNSDQVCKIISAHTPPNF